MRKTPGSEPIRLRTLIALRWVAVAGQLGAIVVSWIIGVRFAMAPALVVVAMAAALNLILSRGPLPRQTESRVAAQLGFDLTQIATLIALTGGLSNPFALLTLAPVTVAATAMQSMWTLRLGIATLILISLAQILAVPVQLTDGTVLIMPPYLLAGHWVALMIAVVFFAVYARRVAAEFSATSEALFATQLALAREQRLQHLGGVVAATAHELGTPLATIRLIGSELSDEITDALPERTDLREDLQLLQGSVDRCRDVLADMGRAGKDDLHLRSIALADLLTEAAAPHDERGIDLKIQLDPESGGEPMIRRDPGLIHGLRNLIQNAVDFAKSEVTISAAWDDNRLNIAIADDGPGFPPAMLTRLGEAPVPISTPRPGYDGMGLGLFIARTLLEGTGARIGFSNRAEAGALVNISCPIARLQADSRMPLRENPKIS